MPLLVEESAPRRVVVARRGRPHPREEPSTSRRMNKKIQLLVRRRVVVAEERVVVDGFRFLEPRFFLTVRIGTLPQQFKTLLVAPINLGLELDDRVQRN